LGDDGVSRLHSRAKHLATAPDFFPGSPSSATVTSIVWGDGFHRYNAAERAKLTTVEVDVHHGNLLEAFVFGVAANAHNGVRRNRADKRYTVERLLDTDEYIEAVAAAGSDGAKGAK
jgi:hypothetical protein